MLGERVVFNIVRSYEMSRLFFATFFLSTRHILLLSYAVAGKSYNTVVFVPPKPAVTSLHEPITDCKLEGKCTVQPVTP